MASDAVLDIDGLIAPISDEQPTGTDLREDSSPDSLYYKIKDARNSARSHERKNMFEYSAEASDAWRTVYQVAPEILKNHAKDIEITSWYIEALIRMKGFAGLRDGFELLNQLIDKFWDGLYPVPDEDGIETKVSPIAGLNGSGAEGVLIAPIRRVLITEGEEPGPYGYWQYQQALDVQKINNEEERNKKIEALGFGVADIEKSVNASSQDFFVNQKDDLAQAIETYKTIGKTLDEHCGTQEAPSTSNIINALQQCLGSVKHLGKSKFPVEDVESDEIATDGTAEVANTTQQPAISGPVQSREQAFEQLKQISEYFLKTEPHSPISYALQKTIKWGDMTLTELINELIPDDSSREHYSSLTGVQSDN